MTVYRLGVLTLEELKSPKHGWREPDEAKPVEVLIDNGHWKKPDGVQDFWATVFGFQKERDTSWYSDLLENIMRELATPSPWVKIQVNTRLIEALEEQILPSLVKELLKPYTIPSATVPKWRLAYRWDLTDFELVGPTKRWNLRPKMTLDVESVPMEEIEPPRLDG